MLNYICVAVEKKASTEAEKVLSHVENINLRKQDRIANGLFLLYTRISPTKQHSYQTANKRSNQVKMKSTVCYEV